MFAVIRRCDPCLDAGCNCDRVTVDCDVDELSAEELERFRIEGTAEQRVEIETWLADEPAVERAA